MHTASIMMTVAILLLLALELLPNLAEKYVDKKRSYALLTLYLVGLWGFNCYEAIALTPTQSFVESFVNVLPQTKSIKFLEAIFVMIWLSKSQKPSQNKVFNALLTSYALLSLISLNFHIQDDFVYLNNALRHALAPLHIISALAAKVVVVGLILGAIAGQNSSERKRRRALISLAISLQALTLLSGMYWALWAQHWGALWQWDAIETQALTLYLVLLIMHRKPATAAATSVFLWLALCLQIAIIHVDLGASRHAFVASHETLVLGLYFFLSLPLFAFLLRQHRAALSPKRPKDLAFAIKLALFLALGLTLFIWLGYVFQAWLLFAVFTLIALAIDLCLTARRPWPKRLITALGILCFAVTGAHLAVPEHSSGWLRPAGDARSAIADGQFDGLAVVQAEPLPIYAFDIQWRQRQLSFQLEYLRAEDDKVYPKNKSLSVISRHGLERLNVTDYKANEGLWLYHSSHNLQLLWGLALALWLTLRHRPYFPKCGRLSSKKKTALPTTKAQD